MAGHFGGLVKKSPEASEDAIHRAVVAWLRATQPPETVICHAANEVRRGGRGGAINRALNAGLGVCAGFPDLAVFGWFGVVFLEVKGTRGRLSAAQVATLARLERLGFRCAVVRSVDDARAAFRAWGIATRERLP